MISLLPCNGTSLFAMPEMDRLTEQVKRVAALETTILLGGETGTGKTRLARQVHELSPRRDQPFLVVNCGALSSNLIESEMFGHVRGAFTGADRDRVGKFAEVGRGTMFLDEVDSLPADVQAKLLRVVEERVFEPVGSNRSQQVRARLIAACNRDLDREVAAGRFRADLYYRLNVVSFTLPPLRLRRHTITDLACGFVSEFSARAGREGMTLAENALWDLQEYHWPGNIRELRNVIERAVALSPGPEIRSEDLPDSVRWPEVATSSSAPPSAAPLPAYLPTPRRPFAPTPTPTPAPLPATNGRATLAQTTREAEYAQITRALERNGNNRLRAAADLGISRMTLYKKLRKYGLMGN